MSQWDIYRGDGRPRDVELPESTALARVRWGADSGRCSAARGLRGGGHVPGDTGGHRRRQRGARPAPPAAPDRTPGSGKSSLIESVARELQLGHVLRWHVTSASTLTDALYRYDAIGRLQAHGLRLEERDSGVLEAPEIQDYLHLGPLGTALLPSSRPRAILIDEIDKSDIDLPNDLLNVFERGEFDIPELTRMGAGPVDVRMDVGDESYPIKYGRVRCTEFPFVVLTSNGERDFPAAFLRRCIRLKMPDPTVELLTTSSRASRNGQLAGGDSNGREFVQLTNAGRPQATDQLLNAAYLVTHDVLPDDDAERARIIDLLFKQLTSEV